MKKGLKLRRLVISEIPNPWLSEVQKVMAFQSVILSGTVAASSAAPESLRKKQSGRGCPCYTTSLYQAVSSDTSTTLPTRLPATSSHSSAVIIISVTYRSASTKSKTVLP